VDERGAHDLWIGYTQVSHWQIWNEEGSRPFRESSYEPEILYTWEPSGWEKGGWRVGHLGLALNHNSNGRGGADSRSWNRVIAFARADLGDTMVTLRAWSRIREGGVVDNPEIEDYYGRADLQVSHQWPGGTLLQATGRHSLRGGDRSRGAIQLDLSLPLCGESWPRWLCADNLRAHAQFFRGYAESLIDYNHLDTYWGVGLSLGAWR
jgi:phospholipase A1